MFVLVIFWWGGFAAQLNTNLEFKTQKSCLEAMEALEKKTEEVSGSTRFFCLKKD